MFYLDSARLLVHYLYHTLLLVKDYFITIIFLVEIKLPDLNW
jgi:hypothetical protein